MAYVVWFDEGEGGGNVENSILSDLAKIRQYFVFGMIRCNAYRSALLKMYMYAIHTIYISSVLYIAGNRY